MDLGNLEKILEGEPEFRLRQAKEAVFKNFISNWNEATFFPKELREKLNKECPLDIKADVLFSKNKDSIKAKIRLKDNLEIEAVLMRHIDGRNTVCVSSQVGCPVGCLFCATGQMGFKRNLSVDEILEQVIFFNQYLKLESPSTSLRVTNVTFMGMGEPFLNYDNVLGAIRILNDKNYFNIGARSISVSTCGIIDGIKKFSKERLRGPTPQLNLAISLHAPNDNLRSRLMPINRRHPLEKVLHAADDYIKITKRKVMFEYVLIDGVNDSDKHAKQLAELMNKNKKLHFLNLILYNPIPQNGAAVAGQAGKFRPSKTKRAEGFKKILKKAGINFVQRHRFGDDIKAACGQFATE